MDTQNTQNTQNCSNYDKNPRRAGNKWNDEEEKQLLHLLNEKSLSEICKIHERAIGGIKSRIRKIAIRMYTSNCKIDDILSKTKLSQEEFHEILSRNKIEKTPQVKKDNSIEIIDHHLKLLNTNMQKIIELLSNNLDSRKK